HVLQDIFRGGNSLDKLWDECLRETGISPEDDPKKEGKKTEATLLGSGESWRFQDGAPYFLSDIPPLVSVGALRGAAHEKSWVAVSAVSSGTGGAKRSERSLAEHQVLLAMADDRVVAPP
ncbi:unnamed protein product, partial [Polarella glacialis]